MGENQKVNTTMPKELTTDVPLPQCRCRLSRCLFVIVAAYSKRQSNSAALNGQKVQRSGLEDFIIIGSELD